MFVRYSHFLAYSPTDQTTIGTLHGTIDGLVVPGTVASFQRQGTGGFLLALSVGATGVDYTIDPRFPLFQQALPNARKAHESLADLFGDPSLVSAVNPTPLAFPPGRIDAIAKAWVQFHLGYAGSTSSKFAKYAARLGKPIEPSDARGPKRILAPYFVASGTADPWWKLSNDFFDATVRHAAGMDVVRVVAATDPTAFGPLVLSVPEDRVVVWVSNLAEHEASVSELKEYLDGIRGAVDAGKKCFALYGGFFSVLASSAGLVGSCHGVGQSEHRNWIELPQSGPPPARYYLPRAHRYVSVELAQVLYRANPALVGCTCPECASTPPLGLDYHELMRHSVRCRTDEISSWYAMAAPVMANQLDTDLAGFLSDLQAAPVPSLMRPQAAQMAAHLSEFAAALR